MMLQGQELAGAVLIPCYPALGHLVRGLAAQVPEWERETDNRDQTLAGSTMNTTVLEPRSAFDLSLSPLKTLTLFTKMADHNLEITVAQLVAVAERCSSIRARRCSVTRSVRATRRGALAQAAAAAETPQEGIDADAFNVVFGFQTVRTSPHLPITELNWSSEFQKCRGSQRYR